MSVEALTAPVAPAHADVVAAIRTASVKTGSDFEYLLGTAMRESGLDSQAKSKGSSASGLFQFIEQTWLGLVKKYGDRHGLADFAAAIKDSGDGHYTVASKETRAAILALRQNAQVSALMAGESAHETKENLECSLGREVCGGELYAAHFLGVTNARRLIALNDKRPDCLAYEEFPHAARANKNIFYKTDGTPKTVGEVYSWALGLPAANNAGAAVQTGAAKPPIAIAFPPQTDDTDTKAQPFASAPPLQAQNIYLSSFVTRAFTSLGTNPAKDAMLPQRPLLLSPGVVEILASLAPTRMAFDRRH